jgi:M6 family metalloprotease-like protein
MTEISWHPIKRFAALSILALGAACASVQAGPASPFPQVIQQPDGSTFEAVMKGDEFQGWMETADGYTVVQNPASKQFEYAAQGANGALVPSGIPVNSGGSNGLKMAPAQLPPKGLRPPKNTELLNFQHGALESKQLAREVPSASSPAGTSAVTGTWSLTPVQGRKKTLVILVNFVDASMSAGSVDYWNNQVFGTGPSVASYYADNSYGKVSIDAVPTSEPGNPPGMVSVRLASNHPNYGNNYNYTQETSWINAALAAAAQYVNFPALDQNGDGTISIDETFIYFILAGYETSAGSGRSPSIWAHAWGGPGVSVAGKSITHWALNGELLGPTNRMTMGVIAHEAGHAMGGLPDLYDISFNNEGLGIFSLMAGGAWGSRIGEIQGSTPVGMDAWSRQYLGWSNPRTIADGVSAAFYSPFVASDSTVILMNPAKSTSEYWLIENRSPQSWDAGMSSYFGQSWPGGLLIQHIDANIGSKSQNDFNRYNAYSHQGNLAEEPSSSPCSMKSSSGSTRGCPGILFGGSSAPDFLESTLPAARYYSGMGSAMGVYGISAPGLTMSATIRMPSSNLPEFSHYDVSTYVPAAARPYQSYLRIINTGTARPQFRQREFRQRTAVSGTKGF